MTPPSSRTLRGEGANSWRQSGVVANRAAAAELPARFIDWFRSRGWAPRSHQLELLARTRGRQSCLLIAPTGAGKTLAGFLPTLIDLEQSPAVPSEGRNLHTLYISPLKALAVDVRRNLMTPVAEMGLGIAIETRTGDTPLSRRERQKRLPPEILLTTPEQLALLISHENAARMLATVKTVVIDELHAIVTNKRGDLLSLGLQRLRRLAPGLTTIGLSATVARPEELQAWLVEQQGDKSRIEHAGLVVARGGAAPSVEMLDSTEIIPWAGHSTRYALPDIYEAIKRHRLSLIFVNTRSQAERVFQGLWNLNDDTLPIALHHGSLDVGQRRKVEAAMAEGRLKAVVATSTLDLGIDWGDVDLVIHVGAPKGASRLTQRIGRANHRLEEPSKALLVPSNCFEVLECRAALEAVKEGAQDNEGVRQGGLDVLAQHITGIACSGPFLTDELFEEVSGAYPYRSLSRRQFDRVVDFVSTGGYALRAYEHYARLRPAGEGKLRLAHPRLAQRYRLNVGTIVEAPVIKVVLTRGGLPAKLRRTGTPGMTLRRGRVLGELEEVFIEQLSPGDTFAFAGHVLRFLGLEENQAMVVRAIGADPLVPQYMGGKFPLSTFLARRVREILADPRSWRELPAQVRQWLRLQTVRSVLPGLDEVLIETFPRGGRHYLVCYPFEGRLAHQTLGMLLTRRLNRAGAHPIGFIANDYALTVWGLADLSQWIASGRLDLGKLFEKDMLGDDLEAWLATSSVMRRTFRLAAVISCLIERRHPGKEKSGRQLTVSSDLLYKVLLKHQPDHVLLEAAWQDAATGLLDLRRLSEFLARIEGRIRHNPLMGVSPLALPLVLEIGRESVAGGASEALMKAAEDELIGEVIGNGDSHHVSRPGH
ncbi:MAG: ligase-associated DNA damage response DEXH box helicase [Hyphomicrobiaceae bacterium]|nr:MAG: ligase-associated DNA damage response DEXH box helicase [Hyphomicrobiaceae bacterium]